MTFRGASERARLAASLAHKKLETFDSSVPAGAAADSESRFSCFKQIFDALPEVTDGPLPAPAALGGAISVRGLGFAHGQVGVTLAVK